MRWIRRLCLALAAACLLSGCSMAPAGVDELLRAPQLTGEQSQVQKALTAYLGEAPQLKYPTQSTGDTYAEDSNGMRRMINRAYEVLVALDENDNKLEVPGLIVETEAQKAEWIGGQKRYELRRQRRKDGF